MNEKSFEVGLYRPVYLWAGSGTVRMNRLKFMDAPVDRAVHAEAHTGIGARRMAGEAGFNWAYLMYNWGFPPEVEEQDWEAFRRAVGVYHDAGLKVYGYVQASNCVYDGSFRQKDWYALDPQGRPFHYYTGRYMACWRHPEWLVHLHEIIRGIVGAGADGVFFDNPWHGCQPLSLGGVWLGPTGCYCDDCRAVFRADTGLEMPESIGPASDETSRRYLRWRARQVTATLARLADYARSLRSDVVIGANNFDAVMRCSYLVYGIDLQALARVQDVVMIEDYGLPRWDGQVLVNNALTLRTARALVGETPLSAESYDKGIGFDGVYSARRFRQGIAEAAACGATMVVKGTEYVEDGEFTLLTARRFAPQRQAIGQFHRWLERHADLYRDRQNVAPVALLYPGEALWQDWHRLAPLYFGVGQALLAEGIPWRVVAPGEDWSALEVLFCFGETPSTEARSTRLRVVQVTELPGWQLPPTPFLAEHAALRAGVSKAAGWLFQAYHRRRSMRRLVDDLGLVHFFWQTPLFRLPSDRRREVLLAAMGPSPSPRLMGKAPVLVETWQKGEARQLHLVNYAAEPQRVTVDFGREVSGQVLSPDVASASGAGERFRGQQLELALDVYAIVEIESSRTLK